MRNIIETRDADGRFTDLFDLAERVDAKQVNRRVFEALIKCGALDGLPGNRAQKLAALDTALELAARTTRDAELGQVSLFGDAALQAPTLAPKLPSVAAPTTREMLSWERETLGIFVSGHPLCRDRAACSREPARRRSRSCSTLTDDAAVTVAGTVTGVRRTLTKAGQQILDRADRGYDRRLRRRALLEDLSAGAAAFRKRCDPDRQGPAAPARAPGRGAGRRTARRALGRGQRRHARSSRRRSPRRSAAPCAAGTWT